MAVVIWGGLWVVAGGWEVLGSFGAGKAVCCLVWWRQLWLRSRTRATQRMIVKHVCDSCSCSCAHSTAEWSAHFWVFFCQLLYKSVRLIYNL